MANVRFLVTRELDLPARDVFDELVDWRGHADWVPLTRVTVESGDGDAGTVFVATSGVGPLALVDRMRVDSLDRDLLTVRITKIGPVLTGSVDLSVVPLPMGRCRIDWVEDIMVPFLPRLLARPVGAAARVGFAISIRRLAKRLAPTDGAPRPPRATVTR